MTEKLPRDTSPDLGRRLHPGLLGQRVLLVGVDAPSACRSADFIATLGISGRAAAPLIASAPLRSFLPRRTNGFTTVPKPP